MPDGKEFILTKNKSNAYIFSGRGFLSLRNNKYRRGDLYVVFNLDYHKDYSKHKDLIKDIFHA